MSTDKDQALTVRLPRALYDQLKAHADAEERTVAGLLRLLARQYLASTGGTTRNCPEPWDSRQ